jgi:hypothetical protein
VIRPIQQQQYPRIEVPNIPINLQEPILQPPKPTWQQEAEITKQKKEITKMLDTITITKMKEISKYPQNRT